MRHLVVLLLVLVPILSGYSRVYTTDGMIYRALVSPFQPQATLPAIASNHLLYL